MVRFPLQKTWSGSSMFVNKEGIVNAKAIIKWKILVNGASIPQFNVEIVK